MNGCLLKQIVLATIRNVSANVCYLNWMLDDPWGRYDIDQFFKMTKWMINTAALQVTP